MQIQLNYNAKQKLKSLSERLKYLARETNLAKTYVDQKIKSENLKFNLSFVISQIILNLKFIDRSKDVFLKIIEEYNKENTTTLEFDDFEKINWIRTVAEEIVLPEVIRSYIWQVGNHEKENKPIDIPEDKKDLVRCLQKYYQNCFSDSKLTISKETLEQILNDYTSKEITINFLIEKKIIGATSTNEFYYWSGNEYGRYLNDEITSTLWLLIGGEKATLEEFKKFFKLIRGTKIWINNLTNYLSPKNTNKICELAILFLNDENDLLNSNNEFRKMWLDASSYNHIDINAEIPVVDFNYKRAYDYIESVKFHQWGLPDIFYYQSTRSYFYLLLQLIIQNDANNSTPYQNVINIIKDISRPFLVWHLFKKIPKEFPEVIPYLLSDLELIPIAFNLLDKIEIDNNLLSEQSNNDKKIEESSEIKNQLWIEMFDIILDHFSANNYHNKEKGEVLAKILIRITEKVFVVNSNNTSSVINHNFLRKRYDEVLKKLGNKRITSENIYPKPLISPRLIFSILPDILYYLKGKIANKKYHHTEFLKLKSGFIDLCIEILRIANLSVSENEISEEQNEKNIKASAEIVLFLKNYLIEFYTANEIEVQVNTSIGLETRKAKRNLGEFGFEIIDWGYLYLLFQKYGIFENLNNLFYNTLKFKSDGDRFDDENKEQFEKIKLYLKSLMLAYISISNKKDYYDINGLPVEETTRLLEEWIKLLSINHSIDKLTENRIDVFNDKLSLFGYDMYHQSLTTLLYRCLNNFKNQNQNDFIKNFFQESNDYRRMLSAINILDANELKDIISKRINEVNIEDFIKSTYLITELQDALIESINSESHWNFAKPLIERIQKHYETVKFNNENISSFLFEINLILAFKEKDFNKIQEMEIPKSENTNIKSNIKNENLKRYFIGLFKLYNDKKYDDAIRIFKSLLSNNTKNIRYAFQLYRAQTLNAIGKNEN